MRLRMGSSSCTFTCEVLVVAVKKNGQGRGVYSPVNRLTVG